MGLLITTDERPVTIFRHDYVSNSGHPYSKYQIGLSTRNNDGTYSNGYLECVFKKGVEVNNKAVIVIEKAFYIVHKWQDKTFLKVMITNFNIVDEGEGSSSSADTSFVNADDSIISELPFA